MWYLGTATGSRTGDTSLGYAESDNGLTWTEYERNPLLTPADLPWGAGLQMPQVLFDPDERIYKMWFLAGQDAVWEEQGRITRLDQQLGYATSADGLAWKIHPQPIFSSGRSPSVLKLGPRQYRMWMNSVPTPQKSWDDLYKHIYEFTSPDGVNWQRGAEPVIAPLGLVRSTVYPHVVHDGQTFYMWYGGHVDGGKFEIFCARSKDGTRWETRHDRAAFPAAEYRARFDSRYTSTPCLVTLPDRYLLYHSARDWETKYVNGQGESGVDQASVYAPIGVAALWKGVPGSK